MGCGCGPWKTCTGKIYNENWEYCVNCGDRRPKDDEATEKAHSLGSAELSLLDAIEWELKRSLQEKKSVARAQADDCVDNSVAKWKHSGIFQALGIIQKHRKKAGI